MIAGGAVAPAAAASAPGNGAIAAPTSAASAPGNGEVAAPVPGSVAPASHAGSGCSFPVTATDATGTEVTVNGEPDRIVALGASTAQTLWEIDAESKVVGVSQFATYLDGAGNRTVVTETRNFSTVVQVEEIVGLNPDVVLAANVYPNEDLQRIRAAGIAVHKFEAAASIEDVYDKTGRIGHLAGACAAANATVERMRGEVETVHEAVSGEERPRVLYPQSGGFAPGPNTFIGGLIDAAGGANVVANGEFDRAYPQLNPEFVVAQDPEWLIVATTGDPDGASPRELVPAGPALRNTTAWEEGNFVVVNANNVSQPAPRIVSPLRRMARAFHPEAYEAAQATPTQDGDETPTATATTGSTPAETEAPGLPGFEIWTAAVALLAALLIATRRRTG